MKWFNIGRFGRYKKSGRYHAPFYNDKADYNTNSSSYYDYLARWNHVLSIIEDLINRLLRRNIKVEDTNSIEFLKDGDWIDNGECEPNNFDDIINLKANVKISSAIETKTLINTSIKNVTVPNGTKVKSDGVWSPDYIGMINELDKEIGKIKNDISTIVQDITNMKQDILNNKNAIQKIVDNLYNSGAITTNNINNFEFKTGRNIATGNINLFGGTADGNSFIRTNKNATNNDITAGY